MRYLPEEDRFLLEAHRATVQARGSQGRWRLNWDQITSDFNRRFEGRVLAGSDTPRPRRTKGSLQSQSARIDEIARITGRHVRAKKPTPPPPPPKRRENGDGEA